MDENVYLLFFLNGPLKKNIYKERKCVQWLPTGQGS